MLLLLLCLRLLLLLLPWGRLQGAGRHGTVARLRSRVWRTKCCCVSLSPLPSHAPWQRSPLDNQQAASALTAAGFGAASSAGVGDAAPGFLPRRFGSGDDAAAAGSGDAAPPSAAVLRGRPRAARHTHRRLSRGCCCRRCCRCCSGLLLAGCCCCSCLRISCCIVLC
jgi:hypothetical protein